MEELIKYVFIAEVDNLKYFRLCDDHFAFGSVKEEVIEYIKAERIYSISISYTNKFNQENTLFLRQLYWIKNIIIVVFQLNLDGLKYLSDLEKIFVGENNIAPLMGSKLVSPRLLFCW